MSTIKLPGLGENVETGVVVKILVSKGDVVKQDQSVIEIETGKSVLELPSPFDGKVENILVQEDEEVNVGCDLIVIADGKAAETTEKLPEPEQSKEPELKQEAENIPEAKPAEEAPRPVAVSSESSKRMVPAAPSVRKFARELGIRIEDVPGTGSHGRISEADVKAYVKYLNQPRITDGDAKVFAAATDNLPPLPDFSAWGDVEHQKMNSVRYETAKQVTRCWSQIPMVTHFDQADITKLEELRKKYAPRASESGGKLTMAVMLVKIAASALKIFPEFNTSVDMNGKEIIYRKYYNIGIAVSSPKGLFVPVLKDVDKKNMVQVAADVSAIAAKAREGKLTPPDMEGGCFTVTNLGNIGGTHFTPIVNYPEVAILGIGRAFTTAGYVDGAWQPKTVLPLSLSYDHRVIDGAEGARFLKWIREAVEEPLILSLEG